MPVKTISCVMTSSISPELDAYHLARTRRREPGRIRQLQRVQQPVRAEVHGDHGREARLGVDDVTARADAEAGRELFLLGLAARDDLHAHPLRID
jgi:hypothetical protein